MPELSGLYPEELTALMVSLGEKPYRAKQLFPALQRGQTVEDISVLPRALKQRLAELDGRTPVRVLEKHVSRLDGTVKLLYALHDGNCIEGVIMRYHYGVTLCVSTQVGCNMGCLFCASTLDGCVRSLSAAEMLGQIHAANALIRDEGQHISRLVLMGSGEPLANYDQVVRFIRLASHEEGLNIGVRHISLSTCGLVPEIRKLAHEGLPVTLSLSLHAPDDLTRRKIMPIARRYTIAETLDACREYLDKTGRRIILEYALIDGINADEQAAVRLAALLRGFQCHVNLIPLNTVRERNLYGVSEKQVRDFMRVLEDLHISVTRRREMGDDIHGACGQLRKQHLEETHQ